MTMTFHTYSGEPSHPQIRPKVPAKLEGAWNSNGNVWFQACERSWEEDHALWEQQHPGQEQRFSNLDNIKADAQMYMKDVEEILVLCQTLPRRKKRIWHAEREDISYLFIRKEITVWLHANGLLEIQTLRLRPMQTPLRCHPNLRIHMDDFRKIFQATLGWIELRKRGL